MSAQKRGLQASRMARKASTVDQSVLGRIEEAESGQSGELRYVNPHSVRANPHQPRRSFDEDKLRELADSIRAQGMLQPLAVRETVDGLELLAGERRQRAAILAGLDTVPVRVLPSVSDLDSALIALTENLAREDLTPWDEAVGLASLRDELQRAGRPVTRDALAGMVGRSGGAVSESLMIADRLTEDVVRLAGVPRQSLTDLPKTALHGASRAESAEERARLIRMAARSAERNEPAGKAVQEAAKPKPGRPPKPWTVSDRLRDRGTLSFNLRQRPQEMEPNAAREALAKLEPVVEALRKRAEK